MLISKKSRPIRKKVDWYTTKQRVHFDLRIARSKAEQLVSDADTVARHPFLPLIGFQKRQRRYRRVSGTKTPLAFTKKRDLAYPSNRDGYIFAYYAEQLGRLYELEIAQRGLSDAVIGYRRGRSNITLARDAFAEICARGECTAIALDIKGFFDNIHHETLKKHWLELLGATLLPNDHWNVFQALTRFATIDRGVLLQRLGFKANTRDHCLPHPLCLIAEFRRMREDKALPPFISRNDNPYGIPQGTPLSALAANLSMLGFDQAMVAEAARFGGSYRRYSDDILIVCPAIHAPEIVSRVAELLAEHTVTLRFNSKKTEVASFSPAGIGESGLVASPKPLQYLGFTFDGQSVRIRSGTLARYYMRMASAVRRAKLRAWQAKQGKLLGRDVVHKRELLARYTHRGNGNFVTGYAKNAAATMGSLSAAAIRRQLSGHENVLARRLRPRAGP